MNAMKNLPPLVGMRVCLNPESKYYNAILENVSGETTGFIVDMCGIGYGATREWSMNCEKNKNLDVTVLFDNGARCNVRYETMMLIDEKCANVILYTFTEDYGNFYTINGKGKSIIEDLLINKGYTMLEKSVYDNKWRLYMLGSITSEFVDDFIK